jgi:AraC-like DNA-binding protein
MLALVGRASTRDLSARFPTSSFWSVHGDDRNTFPCGADPGSITGAGQGRDPRRRAEEPLSAVELAKRAGLSLRQVQRMFQQSLDTTPTKYYLRLRLRRARELLLQSRMSITEIAIACGFQSTCHFSKCYRALYGRTPRSERQPVGRAGHLPPPLPDRQPVHRADPAAPAVPRLRKPAGRVKAVAP